PARHEASLRACIARFEQRGWRSEILALGEEHGTKAHSQTRSRDRRRPKRPPVLAEAVARIAESLESREAPAALSLLRRRAPAQLDAILPSLLEKDESVVCLVDVYDWLHRHRQDLLDPFLGDRVIHGRWATGKSRWILPFRDDFFRWEPVQVERFATALEGIV